MPAPSIKTTFSPLRAIQPFYTGGPVSIALSGALLASARDDAVVITSLATGRVLCELEGDSEPFTAIVITHDASHLVTLSRSLAMRIYSLKGATEALADEEENPGADQNLAIEAELLRTVKAHSSPVVVATADRTGTLVATGGADGLVKVWDIRGGFVTHSFHGHSGLVSALHFFEAPGIAPGAEISSTTSKGSKKKDNKKSQKDAVGGLRLASGGEDGKIRIWNLQTSSSSAVLDSHVSVVRGIDFSESESTLISGSRDRTVIAWDAKSWKVRCTIPVLESVECCGFVPNWTGKETGLSVPAEDTFFYTAGEHGRLRLWSLSRRGEITQEQPPVENDTESIVSVLLSQSTNDLITIRADQVLVFNSLAPLQTSNKLSFPIEPLPVDRQVSGTHDEVIDMALVGAHGTHLALATNTEDVRLISLATRKNPSQPARRDTCFGADTAHLTGHSDIVLALDVDPTGHWLATASKDSTARLWRLDLTSNSYTCHSVYTGHTGALGGIALPRTPLSSSSPQFTDPLSNPPKWLVTGSQDRTIKLWTIPGYTPGEVEAAGKARYTRKAHDKDINALDTSYHTSGPLFASASQDKTVKIWDVESGETIGLLRGHSRGVWTVRFSPLDQPLTISGAPSTGKGRGYVLTGAGDKTVKIWNLSDFSCVATLEGHANSVLKVVWLPNVPLEILTSNTEDDDDMMMLDDELDGDAPMASNEPKSTKHRRTLVASAAADGLVKVWDLEKAECACTLDAHTDRVWALAVSRPAEESSSSSQSLNSTQPFVPITSAAPAGLIISGGADAVINFWADTTSATASAELARQSKMIEEEQRLSNLQRSGRLREAVGLAIAMERPGALLGLFKQMLDEDSKDIMAGGPSQAEVTNGEPDSMDVDGEESSSKSVESTLAIRSRYQVPSAPSTGIIGSVLTRLSDAQLYTLIIWLRDWNASAKSADVAQRVLYALFRYIEVSRLVELEDSVRRKPGHIIGNNTDEGLKTNGVSGEINVGLKGKLKKIQMKDVLAGLKAYTERHQKRNEELEDESFLVEYMLGEMNEVLAG